MRRISKQPKVDVTSSANDRVSVLRPLVEKYVEEALKLCKTKTKKRLRCDEIKFCGKLRTTMGYASARMQPNGRYRYTITISKHIFRGDSHILRETVLHEMAHLIDYQVYRGWGHGPSWAGVMCWMGLEPRVYTEEWEYEALGVTLPKRRTV